MALHQCCMLASVSGCRPPGNGVVRDASCRVPAAAVSDGERTGPVLTKTEANNASKNKEYMTAIAKVQLRMV
jgi:hypothetical protein